MIADPNADADEAKRLYGVEFVSFDSIRDMDAVILAVAHEQFKTLSMETIGALYAKNAPKVLLDLKGLLDRKAYEQAGYAYWRL